MKEAWVKKATVEVDANSSMEVFKVEIPGDLRNRVCFLFLQLMDDEENRISENFYWLAVNDDFTALKKLPAVDLDVDVIPKEKGKKRIYRIRMVNNSDAIAFFVNPSIRKGKKGPEVLPSFWNDNYFSILPGKAKDVTVEFESEQLEDEEPYLKVEGWNISPHSIRIPTSPPSFPGIFSSARR
jgi:hypothetical protein